MPLRPGHLPNQASSLGAFQHGLCLLLGEFPGRGSLKWDALVICWGCCNKQRKRQQRATCWFPERLTGGLVPGLAPSFWGLAGTGWDPTTCTAPSLCVQILHLVRTPVPTLSDFYTQSSAKTLFPSKVTFSGPGGEHFHSSLRRHNSNQKVHVAWHRSFKHQLL